MSTSTFDSFSAGRISGYMVALELISQRPFRGYGFDQLVLADFGLGYQDVHNLWLRLATEAGVFLPLAFAGLISAFLVRVRSLFRVVTRDERIALYSLAAVVFNGLLLTLFEPNTLLGTFQNSASWWASVGALIGLASRRGIVAGHSSEQPAPL
jgi:O-antigen ligase